MHRPELDDDAPEILTAKHPLQWVEYGWLCLTDHRFRATRYKRKAYFEHLMVKSFTAYRY